MFYLNPVQSKVDPDVPHRAKVLVLTASAVRGLMIINVTIYRPPCLHLSVFTTIIISGIQLPHCGWSSVFTDSGCFLYIDVQRLKKLLHLKILPKRSLTFSLQPFYAAPTPSYWWISARVAVFFHLSVARYIFIITKKFKKVTLALERCDTHVIHTYII